MKPRARVVDAVIPVILTGAIAASEGLCPICGTTVPLRHMAAQGRVADHYGCPSCGPVIYATRGLAG